VAPQLLELIMPFMVWGAIGVAVSTGIKLMRARRSPPVAKEVRASPSPRPEAVATPMSAEESMHELGITFDGRLYELGEYRYEKLADAIAYARLAQRRND
jgi:hypothetical protein